MGLNLGRDVEMVEQLRENPDASTQLKEELRSAARQVLLDLVGELEHRLAASLRHPWTRWVLVGRERVPVGRIVGQEIGLHAPVQDDGDAPTASGDAVPRSEGFALPDGGRRQAPSTPASRLSASREWG